MANTNTDTTTSQSSNVDVNAPYTPKRPAPLISISVNHPIATLLKKVKNFLIHKQTLFSTSFSIKVTPLVAIVSLFGLVGLFGGGITTAFSFGRTVEQKLLASLPTPTPKMVVVTPTPGPVIVSISGTIKSTYQLQPTVTPTTNTPTSIEPTRIISGTLSPTMTPTPTPKPTATPTPETLHYILVSRSGSITFLSSNTVHLQNYLGFRVLITGLLDRTRNTLTIAKSEDIEVVQ